MNRLNQATISDYLIILSRHRDKNDKGVFNGGLGLYFTP